ncbi:hypothetical protein B566_EDAN002703 [Ephemera danica]|nr:hypothetical protein B566_EDAN002703 [Ephemera danica]
MMVKVFPMARQLLDKMVTNLNAVQLPNGVDIYMDVSETKIYVKVPPIFYGQTQGMCGTFEESSVNDLKTRWGDIAQSISEFTSSWQVTQTCEVEDETTNRCNSTQGIQTAELKCTPLKTVLGKACSEVVDLNRYHDYCMEAACEGNDYDVCVTYEAYADACAYKGIIVDWRFRVPMCESCICPDGFVYEGYNCVPISQCSCIRDGDVYEAGSRITQTNGNKIENCTCSAGQWDCKPISGARCTNIGHSHYITFDGASFNFASNCAYYLVRTSTFSVEVQHSNCYQTFESTTNTLISTEGLCGLFNNNPSDDMRTVWGQVITSLETFVEGWQVEPDCDSPIIVPEQCESDVCEVLRGELFAECHGLVDFEANYVACNMDMCHSNTNVPKGCASIIDYAQKCADKGVLVNWMVDLPQCKNSCPSWHRDLEHQLCADSCFRSRTDYNANYTCESKCMSGCGCPDGHVIDSDTCVPESQFDCRNNGVYHKPGAIITRRITGTSPIIFETCVCIGVHWECEASDDGDIENTIEDCKNNSHATRTSNVA